MTLKRGEVIQIGQKQNGGAKQTHARATSDGLLELDMLNRQIEAAERDIATAMRRNLALIDTRDALQERAYSRLQALREQTASHEAAVSSQAVGLCRCYAASDPSVAALREMASRRAKEKTAAAGTTAA